MLCKTGSVNESHTKFIALSCRDISLTEPQQVQLFIIGLGNPLHIDVTLQQLESLDDANIFAMAYEQLNASREVPRPHPRQRPVRLPRRHLPPAS
jgi:hypothetical protein